MLLDSDTLSDLSRGRPMVVTRARAYLERHGRLTISVMSVFERLRGYEAALRLGRPYEIQREQFRAFAACCRVLPIDTVVATRAAHIWAGLPGRARAGVGDILIAATAAAHGLVLATRNRRDFERIAALEGVELELVDWSRA